MQLQLNSKECPFLLIYSTWFEKGLNLHQIDVLSNPIYECERDKFTRKSFLFLRELEKSLNKTRESPIGTGQHVDE
jgi:hypothetical protein